MLAPQGAPSQGYGGYNAGNPFATGVADDMQRRTGQMLGQAFAGIRSNAVGTGGVGGGREGIAQGLAAQGAADSLQGNLAGMNSGNWNNDQNRALTNQGQQLGFYTAQRGQDQTDFGLGMNALSLAQSGAWGPVQGMTGAVAPYTGNGTTVQTGTQGGGGMGALGGILGGAQLSKNLGWWGN
jgi:hypothetical protein